MKTEQPFRHFCGNCLVIFFAFLIAGASSPCYATRLPAELSDMVLAQFPGSKVRLDGAIQTSRGELFLPLLPANPDKKNRYSGLPTLLTVHPNREHPDILVYSNGWSFLRVVAKGKSKTTVMPAELPDKLRKQLSSCRFPSDLIVPENFFLPLSLKSLIGETSVQTIIDAKIAADDFGHAPGAGPAAVNGPGSYFFTSLSSGTITLIDEKTLTKVAEFPTEGTPCSMAWADGHLYITDQAKNRVLILDPLRRQFLGQIDLLPRSAPKGIVALANGRLLYVAESGSNDVAVIETATKKVLLRTKVAPGPSKIALTANGNFIVVLNVTSGLVTFISTLNQSVVGTVKVGEVPTSIAITRDSKLAYVTNRNSNTLSVIDLTTRKEVGTIATGTGPTGLTFSLDESKLYVANAKENTIAVYDQKTREKLAEAKLPLDVDFPYSIELMPGGKKLIVSSESTDTIATLDLATMQFDQQSQIGHSSHDMIWVPVR